MAQGIDFAFQDLAGTRGTSEGEALPLHGKQAFQRFKEDGGCHAALDERGGLMFTRFDNIAFGPIVPRGKKGGRRAGVQGRFSRAL